MLNCAVCGNNNIPKIKNTCIKCDVEHLYEIFGFMRDDQLIKKKVDALGRGQ